MLPNMDLFRKGGDRRKKESDGKESPSSSLPKFLTTCKRCGLPYLSSTLLSDKAFIDANKSLLNRCQCFIPEFTKPTVGCENNYQQGSLRPCHQAGIQPHQQCQNFMRPPISPSVYYVPRTSVTPFGNLPVVPFANSPGTILRPRTIPLHPTVSGYQKFFPNTIAPEQKPPESSPASTKKVSDWLRKQDFLSYTTDQEISPSPSSTSQSSDEEQLLELQSQLAEGQRVRNISLEAIGRSSTNLNEETNLNLTEGKMSKAKRNKSCNIENIQDSKKDEMFFGKEKSLISNNKSSNRTSNQVFDAKMSNKEASSGLNKLKIHARKDANHHANDRLKNNQIFDNENKQDLNKQGSPTHQKIIKQSNEKSHEGAKRNDQSFNKKNRGSSRRKNFKPKKIIRKSK